MTDEFDPVHDHDSKTLEPLWKGTLADVVACLEAAFQRMQPIPNTPREVAEIATLSLAEYIGGRALYLPRAHALKTELRHQRIYRDFTGDNIRELVRKYRMSEQDIYGIIRKQRAIERELRGEIEPENDL